MVEHNNDSGSVFPWVGALVSLVLALACVGAFATNRKEQYLESLRAAELQREFDAWRKLAGVSIEFEEWAALKRGGSLPMVTIERKQRAEN